MGMGSEQIPWTEAEPSRRQCTPRTRYHVCAASVGLIEAFARKRDAFAAAVRHWNKEGEPAEVFDSMARVGRGELWRIQAAHPSIKIGESICVPPVRRKAPDNAGAASYAGSRP